MEQQSIFELFSEIEDPRRNNANRQHEFVDILVIALCGMLSAADDWVSIAEYGEAKKDWFAQFLSLPNGIPSHDTFNRVFSKLDPEQFMECFLKWVTSIPELLKALALKKSLVTIDAMGC